MRALVVHDRYDPEASLALTELPEPPLSENDVLVRVHAAGFTRGELAWPATWKDRAGRDRAPTVPGHEVSGVVAALGYGTTGLTVGQRVAGLADWTRDGTLAEYVAVEARNLAPVPPDIDHTVAAALPISGLTAWQALFVHARVDVGQRVLIHGAAGAVGSLAVQLAVRAGADVIGTGRGVDRDAVLAAGAAQFVDIGDGPNLLADAVDPVDVALDVLGGAVLDATVPLIAVGGTLVSIAGTPTAAPAGARCVFFVVEADRVILAHLVDEVRHGRLSPRVDAVCSLDDTAAAFRAPGRTIVQVRQ